MPQCDTQLKDAVDLIVDCAFGQPPFSDTNQIPAPSTCVDVAVRESAYNPLHPQHQLQNPDETIYVAFQQRIQIKVLLTLPWTSRILPVETVLHALMCTW